MQANGREQLRKHTRAFRLTEKIKLQDRLTDTKPLPMLLVCLHLMSSLKRYLNQVMH